VEGRERFSSGKMTEKDSVAFLLDFLIKTTATIAHTLIFELHTHEHKERFLSYHALCVCFWGEKKGGREGVLLLAGQDLRLLLVCVTAFFRVG